MLAKEIKNDELLCILWLRVFNAKARIKSGEGGPDQVSRLHRMLNAIGARRRLLQSGGSDATS
jgi:hypothetical protein